MTGGATDSQACTPATKLRWTPPQPPYMIALVERGGCDFATKVRAAQERGAAGVVVGDMISHPGESEEEGRERESLITMFSPGAYPFHWRRKRSIAHSGQKTPTISLYRRSLYRGHHTSYYGICCSGVRTLDENRQASGSSWDTGSRREGELLYMCDVIELTRSALSSLLSFALLMPSIFLCATIAIHRVRVAR
jgi:hypothetical protein